MTPYARLVQLLDWLVENDEGQFQPVLPFYQPLGSAAASALSDLQALEGSGYISAVLPLGGVAAYQAMVTSLGKAEAGHVRAGREDRATRQWACRAALVSWLYSVDAIGGRTVSWDGFLVDDRSLFAGYHLTQEDVRAAASWLARNDLIYGTTSAEADYPLNAALTTGGESCAEDFGGDVQRYRQEMAQNPSQPNVSVSVAGDVTGVMQVTGRDGKQKNISVGSSSEGLGLALQGIAEIVRTLGYADGREEELEELTERAVEQLTSDEPDIGAVRSFVDWVQASVREGATAAVVAAVTLASTGALDQAGHLLGIQ